MCTQSVSWMSNRQRFKSKESRGLVIKFRMMKCGLCCRTLLDVRLFWVGTGCVNEAVLLLDVDLHCCDSASRLVATAHFKVMMLSLLLAARF